MSKAPIVRAIDIGYGNTKFSTGYQSGGEITCRMFPSLAPQAANNNDLGAGTLVRRDTVCVTINDVPYEVGPDAELAQGGIARNRVLNVDYCKTDAYMALLRGAMSYMGVDHINLLALGLPVSTYPTHKNILAELATKSHKCGKRTVNVEQVRVYPQPLGGFFDFAVRSRLFEQMSKETNLLIDPGFYTLDWLVTSGLKTQDSRSGAANDGGMGSILKAISRQIAADLKCDESEFGDVANIDSALRTGSPLRLFGESVDISKYQALALSKADEAINAMMHTIGRTGDINNIVLVGGGSHFYEPILKHRFPRHKIAVAHEPIFANVRGFHLIAERRIAQITASETISTAA